MSHHEPDQLVDLSRLPAVIIEQSVLQGSLNISRFIDFSEYRYDFSPRHRASTIFENTKNSFTNCQKLIHDIYFHCFGLKLPEKMLSLEVFSDEDKYFRTIDWPTSNRLCIGDILLFERVPSEATDFPFEPSHPMHYHLAVVTGRFYDDGSPELIHANWVEQGVSIWPYHRFFQPISFMNIDDAKFNKKKRYQRFVRAKRLIPDEWDRHIAKYSGLYMYSVSDKNPRPASYSIVQSALPRGFIYPNSPISDNFVC